MVNPTSYRYNHSLSSYVFYVTPRDVYVFVNLNVVSRTDDGNHSGYLLSSIIYYTDVIHVIPRIVVTEFILRSRRSPLSIKWFISGQITVIIVDKSKLVVFNQWVNSDHTIIYINKRKCPSVNDPQPSLSHSKS